MASGSTTVHTVGHSTRQLLDLVSVLRHYDVDLVVDIRGIPRSRHTPQFNSEELEAELPRHGLGYVHLDGLGGRRSARAESVNTGWRNKSFRGYADYMQTDAFKDGIRQLLVLAERWRPVIMCAEAVPWRCHRSLVGDALLVRGQRVVDIFDVDKARAQTLTSFAQVNGDRILYPEAG